MKTQWLVTFAGILAVANAAAAAESDDSRKDPAVQKILITLNNASTWRHPDQFGEFGGVRRYTHHNYSGARKYFEIGALYADKFSQLSLGLMCLNGEGGPKDPLTAEAWMELAAERDYPAFVATRDPVKAMLSPEQRQQADAVHDELDKRYGDAVAKSRMAAQLDLVSWK